MRDHAQPFHPDPWQLGIEPPAGVRFRVDEGAPDPAAPAAGDPLPDPGGDPGGEQPWSLTQEDWNAYQEQQQQLMGAVGALAEHYQRQQQVFAPAPPPGSQVPRPDPWERPDSFQQDLDAYIDYRMQGTTQFQQDVMIAEAEERAQDILADLAAKGGEFDRELAYDVANNRFLPQMVQRYGAGPQAAEAALEAAAAWTREYEQKILQRGGDMRVNQLSTLSGAPGEPGSSYAVGVQQRTMPDYLKEGGSVADRFFARDGHAVS